MNDVHAGLERIQDDAHDVYLVDQRLPDGTGLELIREAKARGATRPFILEWVALGARPDQVLTDVMMPGMSGPEVVARLLDQHRRARVLDMSGYRYDAAKAHGTFWEGAPLVQKPFTPKQLAEHGRRTLDA